MGFEGNFERLSNQSSRIARSRGEREWHRPSQAEQLLGEMISLIKSKHPIAGAEGFRELFAVTFLAVLVEKFPFIGSVPLPRSGKPRGPERRAAINRATGFQR